MVYAAAVCRVRTVLSRLPADLLGLGEIPVRPKPAAFGCRYGLALPYRPRICGNRRPLFLLRVPFGRTAPFQSRKYAPFLAGVRHCRLADRLGLFQIFRLFPPADCPICRKRRRNRHPDAAGAFVLHLPVARLSGLLLPRPARRAFQLARAATTPEFLSHRYLWPDYPRRRIQKRGRRAGGRIGANPYPPTALTRPPRTRRFPDSAGYCQKMVAGGDAGGKLGVARI